MTATVVVERPRSRRIRVSPLTRYVLQRLAVIPGALFVLTALSFALTALIPGDPAQVIAGEYATQAHVAEVRHSLGLDKPLLDRYGDYLDHLVHGDLGVSLENGSSISSDLSTRLPNTLILILTGLLVAISMGLVLGVIAAYFRGRWPDRVASAVITFSQSVPEFFVGLLLILVFYSFWRIAAAPIGITSVGEHLPHHITGSVIVDSALTGSWGTLFDIAKHAVLPVIAIAVYIMSFFAKTVRTAMTQSLTSGQVEFARACGLPERKVIRYALITSRTPILTYSAIHLAEMMGGAAVVETVFAWPGIGQWAVTGILDLDVPVIQGFILFVGIVTMLAYLLIDVVVMLLDPRIRRDAV
jgi:ABC-type dipeptide/oligopeptide/nickel transport system permease component